MKDMTNQIIKEAKKLFVERGTVRAMNTTEEPDIICKWSDLEDFLTEALKRVQEEERKRIGIKWWDCFYHLEYERAANFIDIIEKLTGIKDIGRTKFKKLKSELREELVEDKEKK